MSMLHHLSFAVANLTRSAAFYDAALAPLGYTRLWTQESGAGRKEAVVVYGFPVPTTDLPSAFVSKEWLRRAKVSLWPSEHLRKRRRLLSTTQPWHTGDGTTGGVRFHPEHSSNYFAAFVIDPDGYRIEAVVDEKT
jgi:hypothetical protein